MDGGALIHFATTFTLQYLYHPLLFFHLLVFGQFFLFSRGLQEVVLCSVHCQVSCGNTFTPLLAQNTPAEACQAQKAGVAQTSAGRHLERVEMGQKGG